MMLGTTNIKSVGLETQKKCMSVRSNYLCGPQHSCIHQTNIQLFFYLLLTVHRCIISQINPTRCTILFIYLFISLLYMFRASMRPSSGENYCIYATLALVTLYEWSLVGWLDKRPNQPTRRHPYRVTSASVA
jgi:hypothetical protein